MRRIDYLVIHCTATSQTASLKHILTYWSDELYWQNPGSHYIICPDGQAVQMLGTDKIASGSAGYNQNAINISYIGGLNEQGQPADNRTAAQKVAILKLLRTLKEKFPKAKIQGHRDFVKDPLQKDNATKALKEQHNPGFNAIAEYAHI